MRPQTLLLIAFTLMATGLQFGGTNMPVWLPTVFLSTAFALMLWAFWKERSGVALGKISTRELSLALGVLAIVTWKEFPGSYVSAQWYNWCAMSAAGLILAYATLCFVRNDKETTYEHWIFWILFAGFIALRAGMIVASPKPYIDVYSMAQQSCDNFLQGRNPFVYPIRDIYNGSFSWCYEMRAYSYAPSNFWLQFIGFAATGDVRAITVVMDAISALLIFWMGKKILNAQSAGLLALLFLAQPRALYFFEQAWIEPFLSTAFVVFLFLEWRGLRSKALLAYGFFLSLKQYLAFTALHILILERRWKRLLLILAGAVFTSVPFLLWNASATVREGFFMQLTTCFRDGPNLPSILHLLTAIEPSKVWTTMIGILSAVFFPWWLISISPERRYLLSALGSLFALFLFGSQAVLNYYFFVCTLLLLAVFLNQTQIRTNVP